MIVSMPSQEMYCSIEKNAHYVPYGSFQQPPSQTHNIQQHKRQRSRSTHSDSSDIKNEVVSSFLVKPLNPRPSFPKQAQVLPTSPCSEDSRGTCDISLVSQRDGKPQHVISSGQSTAHNHHFGNHDENVVYIHRQNSFIDVNKMTYRDHDPSRPSSSSRIDDSSHSLTDEEPSRLQISSLKRSHDEVDAAITLANYLQDS
mmetsp:Transcript_4971/g.6425  ORF Transcript_4971/g.6425 Transcript_4971/m.6425 type:complete len:200 (-) Transcript_4971:175-774(-)